MSFETIDKDFFSFEGRLNRKPYIIRLLIASFVSGAISSFVKSSEILFLGLLGIAIWSSLSLGVRRAHDLNRTGWIIAFQFIPILNFVVGIYLLFFKGTEGTNKYGPDPLA